MFNNSIVLANATTSMANATTSMANATASMVNATTSMANATISMANLTAAMADTFVPLLTLSPAAIAILFLSLLALTMTIPTLIWHCKSRSLPAITLIAWIILSLLFNIINALLWPTDNLPVWFRGAGLCDIEVKLELASALGLVCSIAAIMRRLARALDTNQAAVISTSKQRQQRNIVDCLLCFGPPVYMICVHYAVQPSRYYIFAIAGCTPSVDNSWPSIALLYVWPPIFCLMDCYYAVIVLHRLRLYRRDYAHVLRATSSGLNKSRFLRLLILSCILLVIILPVQFYILYQNVSFPLQSYDWARVHGAGWNEVIEIPTQGAVVFDRWIRVALGFIVFACFGIGGDATKMYKTWLIALGLASIFPSLRHSRPGHARRTLPTHRVNGTAAGRTSQESSRLGSLSSKAKEMFARTFAKSSDSASPVVSQVRASPAASPSTSDHPIMSAGCAYEEKREGGTWGKRVGVFVGRGGPRYFAWGGGMRGGLV